MSFCTEIFSSRPSERRSQPEDQIYDFLASLAISFERVDHSPTATVTLCEEVEKVLDIEICKNLFLSNRQETQFYLLMMPGRKDFRTKDLSAQIGSSRLSFGSPEFMGNFLKTEPGSASILGFLFDKEKNVQFLIDEDILENEYIGCHPCKNTSSLKIKTTDLIEKFLPAIEHEIVKVSL